MKFIYLLSLALLLTGLEGHNQVGTKDDHPANFSGTVVYITDRVPLRHAHVWIHEMSGGPSFEAKPDLEGKFSIQLPDDYYEVMVGSPGLQPVSKSIWIDHGNSIRWRIKLCADTENMQDAPDPGPSPKQCSRIWSLK